MTVQAARQRVILRTHLTRASAQRWRSRCLMRSKEAFAYSRSTGYFCSVAATTSEQADHLSEREPSRRDKLTRLHRRPGAVFGVTETALPPHCARQIER